MHKQSKKTSQTRDHACNLEIYWPSLFLLVDSWLIYDFGDISIGYGRRIWSPSELRPAVGTGDLKQTSIIWRTEEQSAIPTRYDGLILHDFLPVAIIVTTEQSPSVKSSGRL